VSCPRSELKTWRRLFYATLVSIFALSLAPFCLAQNDSAPPPATQKPAAPRVKSQDSITVSANLSPEESEDFKINEVFQPIYSLEQSGDCQTAIQRYTETIIPLAEKSKFDEPKNKYLYLANLGIGRCNLRLGNFGDAEKYLEHAMDYLPVWPGLSDSDYPKVLSQIALAQIGQQHWDAAEASLKKSLALFDAQIEKATNSQSEYSRTEFAGVLKGSRAKALIYLGAVYLRQNRREDALKSAELAYGDATAQGVPPNALAEVVKYGRLIATASGDQDAIARWSKRTAGK